MKYFLSCLSTLFLFSTLVPAAYGQVSLGADFVSRYVWRGVDFGESFSVQPALTFGASGFEIGAWASYSISQDGSGANEHDIWASYSFALSDGASVSIGITDYYFPSPGGIPFSDFDDDGSGAHLIEPGLSVTGPESFPVTVYGAFMVYNDPNDSFYLEASVPISANDVALGLTTGFSMGESTLYGTNTLTLINLGLTAARDIKITDDFSLPVFVGFVLNATPDNERTHLVFGFSL